MEIKMINNGQQRALLFRTVLLWCKFFIFGAALMPLGLFAVANTDSLVTQPTEQALSRDFQSLRKITGHFGGGEWNEQVDKWQGKKHQTMQQLLAQVVEGQYPAGKVAALMGEPDEVWRQSSDDYAQLVRMTEWQGQPEGELWAYHWRGRHDQLVFAFKEGKLTAAGWMFNWE